MLSNTKSAIPNVYSQGGKTFANFLEEEKKARLTLVVIACFLFIALIVSILTIAYLYSERREYLSIVEVDSRTGEIVRKYTPVEYTVSDIQRRYVAEQWITYVRRRPADKFVAKDDLLWAYAHTAGAAREQLNAIFRDHDPLAEENYRTISGIQAFKRSGDSFEINWNEQVFTSSGMKVSSADYAALITIALDDTVSTDPKKNPTSLFVIHFDWNIPEAAR
ncbi:MULTISPECIES: type IV secretion system protein [Alphaproteobacteria]|uniref:type IV secretion system protein n=1 Tax=Alphaproteobacteria TaxID=28211 RepID=UPI003266F2A6